MSPGLAEMLLGHGDRDGAPEPSLLPHLARWVEPGALDRLVEVAWRLAVAGGEAPPWIPLWEATVAAALRRGALLPNPLETEVRLATLDVGAWNPGAGAIDPAAIRRRLPPGDDPAGADLHSLLAPILPEDQLAELVGTVAAEEVSAEGARRLVVAAARSGVDLGPDLVLRFFTDRRELPFARRAHLLPVLPEELRAPMADELVVEVSSFGVPPWYVALFASRVAPFATPAVEWEIEGLPSPWAELLSALLGAPPAADPHGDVLRAHPYAFELAAVDGIHETSVGALEALQRWFGPMAGPPDRGGLEGSSEGDDEVTGADGPDLEDFDLDGDLEIERGDGLEGLEGIEVPVGRGIERGDGLEGIDGLERLEEPPELENVARRLQIDVFAGGAQLERAFLAGTDHEVVFSIGREASIGAATPFHEPAFPENVDRIPLTVRVAVGEHLQEGVVHLPKSRRRDSTTWTFSLPVAPDAKSTSALLAVYDGLVLLQAAVIVGSVVPDVAAEKAHDGRIDLQVNSLVHQLAAAPPSGTEGSIVSDGQHLIAAHAGGAIAIDSSALAEGIMPLWKRVEAAADLLFFGQQDELTRLLRDLAFHGRRLRARFVAELPVELCGEGPIQIVAADPIAILPLELIYDGPEPGDESKLCDGWRDSLAAGACTGCPGGGDPGGGDPGGGDPGGGDPGGGDPGGGDPGGGDPGGGQPGARPPVDHPAVCPLRFWGLRRVIEHHTGLGGASGGFEVRSERTDATSALPVFDGAVVAASSQVGEAGVEATVVAARAAFGRASRATTWKQWGELVRTERPAVLVLMPHQATDEKISPSLPALEVNNVLLRQGALTPALVRAAGARGPVVLLLGCNTAGDELPVTSFAGEWRNNGASFVVSTLVEVIADEAPRAAMLLIDALVRAQQSGGSTVGEALLQARRALLSEGLVFSLAVIGHGDPEWKMTEV